MRVLVWIGGGILAAMLAGYIGLQFAISRNGPAVLNSIDRVFGGSQNVERVASATFGPDSAQKLAVYRSVGTTGPRPVILFKHGGSWASGDPDYYAFIGRNFASQGFVVVVAGYRLFPEARYPEMLEDTAGAVGWAYRNIARYGGDPGEIWLIGHSAGAYNVVQTALEPRWLARKDVPATAVRGVVGISGPYDFYPFDNVSTRNSFGDATAPEGTQPVNHVSEAAPPLLLIAGEKDRTVRPRNTRRLEQAMRNAGGHVEAVIYPSMSHNTPLLALAHPWRKRRPVMQRIQRFIAEAGERSAPSSLTVQAQSR